MAYPINPNEEQRSAAPIETSVPALEAPPAKPSARAIGQKNMLHGALWCIGGIVVTATTYSSAVAHGGGTYFVAWGAILFGAIQFLQGAFQYLGSE